MPKFKKVKEPEDFYLINGLRLPILSHYDKTEKTFRLKFKS